jgi:hypothetical protein
MPVLNRTYEGMAVSLLELRRERISGAFREVGVGLIGTIIGNGEHPEKQWIVYGDDRERIEVVG